MSQVDLTLDILTRETIGVLYGGNSAEREVSLNSGRAIAQGLARRGYTVKLIDSEKLKLCELSDVGIDRLFIALHGRGGEDGTLQGALDILQIPYTGTGCAGSALAMDKGRSKFVFKGMGLPTAPFVIVEQDEFTSHTCADVLAQLGDRVMVKPIHEGSSIGMSQAKGATELSDALVKAFEFDTQVLIEAWIDGPEYTVAILDDKPLPAIRMTTPNEFYDYEAKYQLKTTEYMCPCGLEAEVEAELQSIALKAFKALGASGWGRVDIMRNADKEWQILEVNTVPGMTQTSLVPKAAKAAGISFERLVEKILAQSVK